jgi:hypothetical protein
MNNTKEWIDNASYMQLLDRWRHSLLGDPMFVGELGDYYSEVMSEKKADINQSEQVQISKNIGWGE